MIQNVYVIRSASGLCLLSRRYGEIQFNEDLISGFLTALRDFSKEVTGGEGIIRVLDMKSYNVILVFRENLMIAAGVDKHDNKNIAMTALGKVLNQFTEKFNLDRWDGNISMFKGFESVIDEILESGKISDIPVPYPKLKKKLPKMILRMGEINQFEYDVAHLCDGKRIIEDIAVKMGKTEEEIYHVLEKLKRLGLVEF
ncbi:MAG: hypothetical protein HWN67_19175 [Candidatus Helarchaeota archaeon]|nr:hypothetical protein [Candidatus Helarchaeota archaeon]